MSARRAALLAWVVSLVVSVPTCLLIILGGAESTPADSFGLTGWGGFAFLLAAIAFGSTGALLAARVPGNAIGWVFCVTGVLLAVGDLAYQYADYVLYVASTSLPGGRTAAWLQNLAVPPAFGLLALSLLLFPDGRLLSRRWRPVLWLALTGIFVIVIGYAVRPGPLDEPFEGVANPVGVGGAFEIMSVASELGWLFMAASLLLAAASVVVRRRRSQGRERQQIRWIALAAAVAGAAFAVNVVSFFVSVEGIDQLRIVLLGLVLAGFPVATGIAILRHRLYDIDVVINRTLVYGALTATLAGVYLGSVLLLQLALSGVTDGSELAVAASTLGVAALFRPARARIQAGVDHRFFRRKYNAARTLESFSARLRVEVDLDALTADLCAVVSETMQPGHVSIWVRVPEDGR
jgi:hypothetical protein